MIRLHKCLLLSLAVTTLLSRAAGAQVAPHARLEQSLDKIFPYPVVEGAQGQRDAAAMKEFAESAAASIPDGWLGIQASGTAMAGATTRECSATLDVARKNKLRLDCESAAGRSSLRIQASKGVLVKEDGTIKSLGISPMGGPFPMIFDLWTIAQLPSVSVVDDGGAQVAGKELHKITLIYPAPSGSDSSGRQAIALYFDPANHLLIHVVRSDRSTANTAHMLVHVSTYGDYRAVENAQVPFFFMETEDGHLGLRFQATNVVPEVEHDDSYFHF